MVLLMTRGELPVGSSRLMAEHGFCAKTLLAITGDDSFTNDTTPDKNCVSHELWRNTFRAMIGDALFPPMAAPNPPPPWLLAKNTFPSILVASPLTAMPAPNVAVPPVIVKPAM